MFVYTVEKHGNNVRVEVKYNGQFALSLSCKNKQELDQAINLANEIMKNIKFEIIK